MTTATDDITVLAWWCDTMPIHGTQDTSRRTTVDYGTAKRSLLGRSEGGPGGMVWRGYSYRSSLVYEKFKKE